MKNSKYFLTTAVTAAMVASAITPVALAESNETTKSTSFPDVKEGNHYYTPVMELTKNKVINGYEDGTFRPNQKLNRAHASVLFQRALDLPVPSDYLDVVSGFEDVPTKSAYADEVAAVVEAGIFNGYNGEKFGLTDELTREQMASVLVRAFDLKPVESVKVNFTDMNKISPSHKENVIILAQNGITSGMGDGTFSPKTTVTRGQFATFLYNSLKLDKTPEVVATDIRNNNDLTFTFIGSSVNADKVVVSYFDGVSNVSFDVAVKEDGYFEFTSPAVAKSGTYDIKYTAVKGELKSEVETHSLALDASFAMINVADTSVDNDTDKQLLTFKLDNKVVSPTMLSVFNKEGYTFQFKSTKDVFADNKTGELDEAKLASVSEFEYLVEASKDGKVVSTSTLAKVKVEDFSTIATSINSYELTLADGVKVESGKVAMNDVMAFSNVKATFKDGNNGLATPSFKSSDNTVAVVSATGVITPIKPGTVNITLTSGEATKTVALTVVAEARTATNVYFLPNYTLELVNGITKALDMQVVDQYGDAVKGFDSASIEVKAADGKVIATSDPTATDVEGKVAISVIADNTNIGTGKLIIKNADKEIKTLDVSVGQIGTVTTRKLELSTGSDDNSLDIRKDKQEMSLTINYNQYNENKYFMGTETDMASESTFTTEKFKVVSSDKDVATVSTTGDTITVTATGTKTGVTKIEIMEGAIVRDTMLIYVSDSTPTIKSVNFESNLAITTEKPSPLTVATSVLKPSNIVLSTEEDASISPDGVVYLDTNEDGAFVLADDIKLADLTLVSSVKNNNSDIGVIFESGKIGYNNATVASAFKSGDSGEIILSMKRVNDIVPFAVTTINVNVK